MLIVTLGTENHASTCQGTGREDVSCIILEAVTLPKALDNKLMLLCALSQEFAGEDTSDLFLEERETALRQAQEEKHKLQMSVPGILNPHEIPEEMCD